VKFSPVTHATEGVRITLKPETQDVKNRKKRTKKSTPDQHRPTGAQPPNQHNVERSSIPSPDGRRWLTVAEAALYLNISATSVRRLIRKSAVQFARVGRKLLVCKRGLDTFMSGGGTPSVGGG
jgi:excisionase family DNA binding protein